MQGLLRTREVMERLKTVAAQPGQKPPILVYLGVLLQRGKLNAQEGVELARCVACVCVCVCVRGGFGFVCVHMLLNTQERAAGVVYRMCLVCVCVGEEMLLQRTTGVCMCVLVGVVVGGCLHACMFCSGRLSIWYEGTRACRLVLSHELLANPE